MLRRDHDRVGDDVIDVVDADRPRESQVVDLDGAGPEREDPLARTPEVAVEVDEDVDPAGANRRCRGSIREARNIDHFIEGRHDAAADLAAVIHAVVEGKELEAAAIVQLEELRHQDRRRLVPELAGHIAHADPRRCRCARRAKAASARAENAARHRAARSASVPRRVANALVAERLRRMLARGDARCDGGAQWREFRPVAAATSWRAAAAPWRTGSRGAGRAADGRSSTASSSRRESRRAFARLASASG